MTLPRQRGLTEQAVDAPIDTACRMLRLPSIRNEFSDIADRAIKDQMTYRGFLAELLMAECDDRARRRSERRVKAAGFPREKSLRTFDFDANPNIDPATIHTLTSCEWIRKGQPLCLIGDSGTGKSHMLIALGTEAAMKGYRVRYTLATKLVNGALVAVHPMAPGRRHRSPQSPLGRDAAWKRDLVRPVRNHNHPRLCRSEMRGRSQSARGVCRHLPDRPARSRRRHRLRLVARFYQPPTGEEAVF
ncbi:ATP-binding protein [Streptomyces sp. NPDC058847]|uniref:ATP-binding protein n=1 Tax=Streptomyces sp. NPDC058847 TaxID=3346649 RepID=UPI0036AA3F10